MHNLEQLYKQAFEGDIEENIIPDLILRLRQTTTPEDDKLLIIGILAEHGNPKYASDIEPFLTVENPFLVRKALKVLCHWDEDARYAIPLVHFMRGVSWDEDNFVRDSAISSAGEWLRRNNDTEVLAELVRAFSDKNQDDDERSWTYRAIGRAMGLRWDELPSITQEVDLNADVNPLVVERAKRRLKSLKGQ